MPSNPLTLLIILDKCKAYILKSFYLERERWFLWVPVLMGAGIGFYFALEEEPEFSYSLYTLLFFSVCAFLNRRFHWKFLLLTGLALVASGFFLAKARSDFLATPMIKDDVWGAHITAHIIESEKTPKGQSLTLGQISLDKPLYRDIHLDRIKISSRNENLLADPGRCVKANVSLWPAGERVLASSFDFARHAYFNRISAYGFVYGDVQISPCPEHVKKGFFSAANQSVLDWIGRLRNRIERRISAQLQGNTGAVASALIVGIRGPISDQVLADMRDSGLAHLLAISGLHMGLVAGFAFFSLRLVLALIPRIVLFYNTKKIAAIAALFVGLAYLFLSGHALPAQRAFLMVSFVMLAVLLDRRALSLRTLAIAAIVILVLTPENLLSPSFQMSFAAVTVLIAFFESNRRFGIHERQQRDETQSGFYFSSLSILAKSTSLIGKWLVSSALASFATNIFAAYHFHQISLVGVIANMVAIPLTSFWIMPMAFLALLLMPFKLAYVPLFFMGLGVDWLLSLAEWSAGLGGTFLVPPMPVPVLIAFVLSGLWVCLWKRRWRYFGLFVMLSTFGLYAQYPRPDILVDGDGELLAIKSNSGEYLYMNSSNARALMTVWQRDLGLGSMQEIPQIPRHQPTTSHQGTEDAYLPSCDSEACIFSLKDKKVALAKQPTALVEDCWYADILITPFYVPQDCYRYLQHSGATLVRLYPYHGSYALWIRQDHIDVQSSRDLAGKRPWNYSENQ